MNSSEFRLDHDHSLVRVTLRGRITRDQGEETITRARRTAAEHGYAVLYDVRETHTEASLASWFYMPRKLEVFKDPKSRNVRVAVLISPNGEVDAYRFYEVVTSNLGLSVRIFVDDENAALRWLAGDGGDVSP